ncbi:MAG: Rne/Rng family ribonuclease, partial [SAR324 cluster bacterium]|nr:Rne/Rng family ribonuclease [SAR324 cluster bacterium]
MSKEIIINHSHHETRVALMEDGMLTELQYEREREQRIVGNIYKGRVVKVLPGMESAFIDIGAERAAFLHIDDILPEEEMDSQGKRNSRKEKQPIDKLLKEGNPILVQVSKGPIGTKGARITGHVSMPGRNLVYIPGSKTLGVSRQIADERERDRLKNIVNRLKPEDAGFIIRTVAENRSEDDLHSDINYLISLWEDIREKYQTQEAPSLLHSDLNVIFRTLRDLFSSDIKKLVVDHKEEYKEIKNFVRSYLPRYGSVVEHYSRRDPIFDHYNIEMEIERALSPKVWLRSGGSLVINQTEALTAIDVNTGRFVGKESHEKTILRTNLEAAEEVVYQLQLRNIGGIIIIDFIDMDSRRDQLQLLEHFTTAVRDDAARPQIAQLTELGLVELTRKR